MSLIFSSFSQNEDAVLTGLEGEVIKLVDYFAEFEKKNQLEYFHTYNRPLSFITTQLIDQQNDLKIFHYSGHSTNEHLDLVGDDFDTTHFTQFFNALNNVDSKIHCVFLNGCTNEEIVKKLYNVPVVIGTKTPILNKDAIKFTEDFFRSLLSGKNSYKVAFNQARKALAADRGNHSIVRGINLKAIQKEHSQLNKYFLVINDEKIASSKFPLNRVVSTRSWARYSSLLLTLVFLFLSIFFKDFFIDRWRGYSCPGWVDDDKCNILIGNTLVGNTLGNIDKKIADAMEFNDVASKYIEPQDVLDWSSFIHNSKKSYSVLPNLCQFEYIMTGFFNEKKKTLKLRMYNTKKERYQESHNIGKIDDLIDTLNSFNPIYHDSYFMGIICKDCVSDYVENTPKEKALLNEAEKQTNLLKNKPGAELAFQDMSEGLATKFEIRKNKLKAIRYYQEVADVDINDKALAAREKQSILEEQEGQIAAAYASRFKYRRSIEKRQQYPHKFEMKEERGKYEDARQDAIYESVRLVIDHPIELSNKKEDALQDIFLLRNLKKDKTLYTKEINVLKEDTKLLSPVVIKIRNPQGQPISSAYATLDGYTFRGDDTGIIEVPCPTDNCINKTITIRANSYKPANKLLKRNSNGLRIILYKQSVNSQKARLVVTSNQSNIKVKSPILTFKGKEYTSSTGEIEIPCPNKDCVGQTVNIKAIDHQSSTARIQDLKTNIVLKYNKPEPPITGSPLVIKGKVVDENGRSLSKVGIVLPYIQDIETSADGSFKIIYPSGELPEHQDVTMMKDGLILKITTLRYIMKNPIIRLLKSKPQKYTLSGTIKDSNGQPFCDAEWTFGNENYRLPVNNENGKFHIIIIDTLGKYIKIKPPEGFRLSSQDNSILVYTDEINMVRHYVLREQKPTKFQVKGKVAQAINHVIKSKPIVGATITPSWKTKATKTDKSGVFGINSSGYFCNSVTIKAKGYQSKTVSLRKYYKRGTSSINLGEVYLEPFRH